MEIHSHCKPELDATRIPTELEVAWAAGVYEGEGSCCEMRKGSGSFMASIAQKDPELLYRLRDLFGGSIAYYKAGKAGRFNVYRWSICGDRGRVFLMAIYPFLTSRRKAQIDKTSAGRILDSMNEIPVAQSNPSLVVAILKEKADAKTKEYRERAKRERKAYLGAHYRSKSNDPAWMEKRRQNTRDWRLKRKEKLNGEDNVVSIA